MAKTKLGELNVGWFILTTLMALALALGVFVPLSHNMKTINETSDAQKRIDALEKRVAEVDVLRGQLDEMRNRTQVPEATPGQKIKRHRNRRHKPPRE